MKVERLHVSNLYYSDGHWIAKKDCVAVQGINPGNRNVESVIHMNDDQMVSVIPRTGWQPAKPTEEYLKKSTWKEYARYYISGTKKFLFMVNLLSMYPNYEDVPVEINPEKHMMCINGEFWIMGLRIKN